MRAPARTSALRRGPAPVRASLAAANLASLPGARLLGRDPFLPLVVVETAMDLQAPPKGDPRAPSERRRSTP